jgi:hypothetical protein
VLRLIALANGFFVVDEDGPRPLHRFPHVRVATRGVQSLIILPERGTRVGEDIGGTDDRWANGRMRTRRTTMRIGRNVGLVT